MKKTMAILSAILVLFGAVGITAGMGVSAAGSYAADTASPAQWVPVYVKMAADRTTADVKNMSITNAVATMPEEDANSWEQIYCHANDATKYVASSSVYEMGFAFTAPFTGAFRLDFSGYCPDAHVGEGVGDGMGVKVYDKDLTELATVISSEGTADVATIAEEMDLAAGEKVYVFFNMNTTPWNDRMMINKLTMTPVAKFTPINTDGVSVMPGATFDHFYNGAGDTTAKALWTPFYLDANGQVATDMDYEDNVMKIPAAIRTGDSVYAMLGEVPNATYTCPIGQYTLGDYFTAPAAGTVHVSATYAFDVPLANSDGIGVTVYKNKIAEEAVIIERTLFNFTTASHENTAGLGKTISAADVPVDKGDVIIFVYDYNSHYYSDSAVLKAKAVTYTTVDPLPRIFHPDITKVRTCGSEIQVLSTLTVNDLISNLGAWAQNVAFYMADGTQIVDGTLPISNAATVTFYNDVAARCPIGTYTIKTVSAFDNTMKDVQVAGAGIRTATSVEKQGLRFTSYLNSELAEAQTVTEVGMVLLPAVMLGSADLTLDTPQAVAAKITAAEDAEAVAAVVAGEELNATLIGAVQSGRFAYEIVARAYMKVMIGGVETVIYGAATQTRSVANVTVAMSDYLTEQADTVYNTVATVEAVEAALGQSTLTQADVELLLEFCRLNYGRLAEAQY